MAKTFNTIKRYLTRDEKKQVVNSHNKFGIPLPDNHTYQSFMKADIQDEFIIMKCCVYVFNIDGNMVNFFNHF